MSVRKRMKKISKPDDKNCIAEYVKLALEEVRTFRNNKYEEKI